MSGEHAPLAPSKWEQWSNCPGSFALTGGMVSKENDYAREGTFAHAVAARLLEQDKEAHEALAWHGDGDGNVTEREVVNNQAEFEVDAEMVKHLQVYLNTVRRVLMTSGGALCVEQKVTLSSKVYGTLDAAILDTSGDLPVLHVFDLKYGAGVFVSVIDNGQLMIYALAALATAGYNTGLIQGVHLHIVQPRCPDSDGEVHRSVFIPAAELEQFRRRVAGAELAAMTPGAKLEPGDWCRWCPARGNCPALRNRALVAAQGVFVDLTDAVPAVSPAPPVPSRMTPVQIANLLATASVIETWIGAVREEAFRRAKIGTKIPGYKLVRKLGHRRWKDEKVAADTLRKFGIRDPFEHTLISPAQAEKLAKTLKSVTPDLTERPLTNESLVPDADDRPTINPALAFEVLQ